MLSADPKETANWLTTEQCSSTCLGANVTGFSGPRRTEPCPQRFRLKLCRSGRFGGSAPYFQAIDCIDAVRWHHLCIYVGTCYSLITCYCSYLRLFPARQWHLVSQILLCTLVLVFSIYATEILLKANYLDESP